MPTVYAPERPPEGEVIAMDICVWLGYSKRTSTDAETSVDVLTKRPSEERHVMAASNRKAIWESEQGDKAGVTYRTIPGYVRYCVGDDGSVWSNCGYQPGGGYGARWRLLRQNPTGCYAVVGLCREGCKVESRTVHRLVLEAFVGPCPKGCVAAHNNGKPRDNRLANLRWDTPTENIADKKIHGTHLYGKRLAWTRLKESDVVEIRRMIGIETLTSIGTRFGVTRHQIASIRDGKSWAWM